MKSALLLFCVLGVEALWITKAPQQDEEVDNEKLDATESEVQDELVANFQPSDELIKEWLKPSSKHLALKLDDSLERTCTAEIKGNVKEYHAQCADPWIETKQCDKAYEVPGYRLGDLVNEAGGSPQASNGNGLRTTKLFPGSIGAQYWALKTKRLDYAALEKVVDSQEYSGFERPDNSTLVVHVRAFDVLVEFQQKYMEKWSYQKSYPWYGRVADRASKAGFNKAIIVTGDHHLKQSSQQDPNSRWKSHRVQEALKETKHKVDKIQNIFESKGFTVNQRFNYNADCDVIYMVNAKAFVPSGGKFSGVITQMVERKHGKVFYD